MAKRGGTIGPMQGHIPFDEKQSESTRKPATPLSRSVTITDQHPYVARPVERACAVMKCVEDKHMIGGLAHVHIATTLQEVVHTLKDHPDRVGKINSALRIHFAAVFEYATSKEKEEIKGAFTGIPYAEEVLQGL